MTVDLILLIDNTSNVKILSYLLNVPGTLIHVPVCCKNYEFQKLLIHVYTQTNSK